MKSEADIPNYERYYKVTEYGQVISLPRVIKNRLNTRTTKERILKTHINIRGYECATLIIDNMRFHTVVHRLVAQAFVPNPFNKPFINHKNGIKTDNHYSNLEWCTQKENVKHSFTNGLQTNIGENNPKSQLTEILVKEIRNKYELGDSIKSISMEYNVTWNTIAAVVKNRTWTHL